MLLDQTLVSGIENIYADEALWAAKVHGKTEASSVRSHGRGPRSGRNLV